MSSRWLQWVPALALAGLATACGGGEEGAAARPNLLLITVDTLRADHLGTYGYTKNTSPNIDRFAERSIVFEQCMSPSSWTMPAHTSVMTGLSPLVHNAGNTNRAPIAPSIDTLAEVVAREGYRTAAFTDGLWVDGSFGFRHGFEVMKRDREIVLGHVVQRDVMNLDQHREGPLGQPGNIVEPVDDVHLPDRPVHIHRTRVQP